MDTRLATARLAEYFEKLTPDSVAQLPDLYDGQARFKDPFNEVQGLAEIERIFRHMYVALDGPHFVITGQLVDGAQAFLTWEFRFRFKRFDTQTLQVVRGGSHIVFNEQGMVTLHRDYWDAAEELYEKLPVVGGVMRWLKKRANT
ncbi:nuclear transport factor 2 family protein [Limnohabitans lacus]|uniref:Nuclear transport factor 2 family protein n=1 Tax=Limnohabitans lacus TaxID=3045173 RepID=A0ABT6X4G9_9BURK|nr:nuclear transport factor 2 family protein [Limnohabitans sp. HM2-2]MDI9233008.1 nuclear transport factor 2 family protein [Limnohabitans sp. HM2-2]